MKNNNIIDLYDKHPVLSDLLSELLGASTKNINVEGLSGSAKSVVISKVFQKTTYTHIIVLQDKENAAYFYNDMMALTDNNDAIFFFPSTYKRSVQYEQTEPANIVLRTEVLNYLASGKRKCVIVSYPEALMEKVISKRNLKKNTFNISVGDKLSQDFIEEMLQEYNFECVDFVYEPGQYSIRGSIVDIFSYTTDRPYRIDFFGENVESIRTFNTDDQRSVETKKQVSIIPNIQDVSIEEINDSFLDFVPPSTMIWFDNSTYIKDKINDIYNQTVGREDAGQISGKRDIIITGNRLMDDCRRFKVGEFGKKSLFNTEASFSFNTEPQPVFNKNFEILAEKLILNRENGIDTYIVSENQSQIDRLRDIFAEVNPKASFNASLLNLHAGFTDNDVNIAIYTDHQIFDRYHKFRIKGYFTKKESLSIKELTSLNPGDYVV
ncbi:MAG: transcription-repair coupling factor, partial [Bacteroidales bacterium]|nr:transcription-repair coupling factor [Bacteroidales bacterium]